MTIQLQAPRNRLTSTRNTLCAGDITKAKSRKSDRCKKGLASGYAVIYAAWSVYSEDFLDVQFGPMFATEKEAVEAARRCAEWKRCQVRVEVWDAGTGAGGRAEKVVRIIGVSP